MTVTNFDLEVVYDLTLIDAEIAAELDQKIGQRPRRSEIAGRESRRVYEFKTGAAAYNAFACAEACLRARSVRHSVEVARRVQV